MRVTESAFAFIEYLAFIWRVGRDPDVQIMPTACLKVAEL
jgi:hypothetical protein